MSPAATDAVHSVADALQSVYGYGLARDVAMNMAQAAIDSLLLHYALAQEREPTASKETPCLI